MEESELLESLHSIELNILKDFDMYCQERHLKYSLYAGTMLGAVRHDGFIPWDDDIDVAMTRAEYERFRRLFNDEPLSGYYFENCIDDPTCGTCHGKLRKLSTIFLQQGDIESVGHHEVWLDIFPLDKLPKTMGMRKVGYIGKMMVALTRANVDKSTDKLPIKIARHLLRIVPKKVRKTQLMKASKWLEQNCNSLRDSFEWTSMSTLENIDTIRFPKELCEEYTTLSFEKYQFMSFKNYREMLSILYGDYMKLPPIEDRMCRHKPIKVKI